MKNRLLFTSWVDCWPSLKLVTCAKVRHPQLLFVHKPPKGILDLGVYAVMWFSVCVHFQFWMSFWSSVTFVSLCNTKKRIKDPCTCYKRYKNIYFTSTFLIFLFISLNSTKIVTGQRCLNILLDTSFPGDWMQAIYCLKFQLFHLGVFYWPFSVYSWVRHTNLYCIPEVITLLYIGKYSKE